MRLVRRWVERLEPDLVGLQEIVVRRDGLDQAKMALGESYERVFGAAVEWNERGADCCAGEPPDGAFGNCLASRWRVRRSEVRFLPGEETGERRCVVAALVEAPFGLVPFFVTHLNWKFDHGYVRERQVLAVADLVESWSREGTFPPVLVGDMNAEPDSDEIRFLCGLRSVGGRSFYLQDAWRVAGPAEPGYTWDNRNPYAAWNFEPNRRIDYIFVGMPDRTGRGWVESVRLVANEAEDGVFPSDHFGLYAEIRT